MKMYLKVKKNIATKTVYAWFTVDKWYIITIIITMEVSCK